MPSRYKPPNTLFYSNVAAAETMNDQDKELVVLGGMTDRSLAALRSVLAVGALLIIYVDPTEPNRYVTLTYNALIAYSVYSLAIWRLARPRINFSPATLKAIVWTDVAWYSALI